MENLHKLGKLLCFNQHITWGISELLKIFDFKSGNYLIS